MARWTCQMTAPFRVQKTGAQCHLFLWRMRPTHCAVTSCDPSLARTSPQAGGHLIRLVVECAFGLLSSQWRMYRRVISVKAAKAEDCVKATCILHNYLRMTGPRRTTIEPNTSGQVEGSAGLVDADRVSSNNAARAAIRVREKLSAYFNAEGALTWQPPA